MKITSIKQQVKNPDRVSIFVDSKYSFSLSLDEIVKYKIKNGQELQQADIKKLKKISEDGKTKARALNWILGRPHSVREFRDYMFRKKADKDLVEQLVEEFKGKKYLDDDKFAQWFAELKQRAGKSNRQIQAELFKKGISRDIVGRTIEEQGVDENERLNALVAKKIKSARYRQDPLKLKQYLARQGFEYQAIEESIKSHDL
jgi:regulatory protein